MKSHNYYQREGQPAQECIKDMSTLYNVVKAVDGSQGVGVDGEVLEEVESMLQNQHGTTPTEPSLLE